MRPRRVYETVVYATALEAAAAFYRDVLGLREVDGGAFRLDDGGVLLLFDPGRSSQPGRPVPSHGATGAGHVAFSVGEGELDAWREELLARGIELEQEQDGRGAAARSISATLPATRSSWSRAISGRSNASATCLTP